MDVAGPARVLARAKQGQRAPGRARASGQPTVFAIRRASRHLLANHALSDKHQTVDEDEAEDRGGHQVTTTKSAPLASVKRACRSSDRNHRAGRARTARQGHPRHQRYRARHPRVLDAEHPGRHRAAVHPRDVVDLVRPHVADELDFRRWQLLLGVWANRVFPRHRACGCWRSLNRPTRRLDRQPAADRSSRASDSMHPPKDNFTDCRERALLRACRRLGGSWARGASSERSHH